MNLEGLLSGHGNQTQTVDPTKLIYVPSENVHALGSGGRLWEDANKSVQIELGLHDGTLLTLSMLKGRNRNIQINLSNVEIAKSISSLEEPFTIFTPGLAGIAKYEQYVSSGVLLRTIARGDANLVLRNTLLRLWDERTQNEKWNKFIFDLKELFPDIDIRVLFASGTDEFINVSIETNAGSIPLELSGTGVLQTIQILSYIHYFSPRIIVLDEPDSHLHPNNQRLICSLLSEISQQRGVQVLLSTHSRHVLDSLHTNANLLWVRDGQIESIADGSGLSILLDLGALDIKEQLRTGLAGFLVLTEDEKMNPIKILLESSGFNMQQTDVKSYYGCTSLHNLRPLIDTIKETNPSTIVIVHKDRDYNSDAEIVLWETEIRAMGVEPFVTKGVDIESHFINPQYLEAENENLTLEDAQDLIDKALTIEQTNSISHYVNGRCDIEKKARTYGKLDLGNLAARALEVYMSNPPKYCHSKTIVSRMRRLFQEEKGVNLETKRVNILIASPELSVILRRNTPLNKRSTFNKGNLAFISPINLIT